jgi:hypothetical protein
MKKKSNRKIHNPKFKSDNASLIIVSRMLLSLKEEVKREQEPYCVGSLLSL